MTLFLTETDAIREIAIRDYESFKVLSHGRTVSANYGFYTIEIEKAGRLITTSYNPQTPNVPSSAPASFPMAMAGPATVRFKSYSLQRDYGAWLTVDIQPEPFDVGRTITLAPGNGAAISLECTTNLVNWSPATNGVYTRLNEAKFFRIKAERLSAP
ncbi:MAG TPA: hypothetical protein VJ063_14570 [Verrucomicrobiae bacterium]|nr:hypothetical protein [Verrucomicrobiae bacterium]